MDYSLRAAKLRTTAMKELHDEREREALYRRKAYTQDEYWEKFVRSYDDVVTFYELYFPSYPRELCLAMANRMREKLQHHKRTNTPESAEQTAKNYFNDGRYAISSESEVQRRKHQDEDEATAAGTCRSRWDYRYDLSNELIKGKFNQSLKHLEALELSCSQDEPSSGSGGGGEEKKKATKKRR